MNKRQQLGLSLIELMVALGLGIFLLAGILQVFAGSRQSFEIIQGQSSAQEAGRFGLYFIEQSVLHAGYLDAGSYANPDDFASDMVNLLSESSADTAWPSSDGFTLGSIVSSPTVATAKAGTDTLSVRMQGDIDGLMLDCEGKPLLVAVNNTLRFFIDGNNQLNCQVITGTGSAAVALVSGVEDMQVLYGISGASESRDVTSYVTAAALDVDSWKQVVSVRIGLMTVSDNAPLDQSSKTYQLLDKGNITTSDGNVRQVYVKTITIRSRMNG